VIVTVSALSGVVKSKTGPYGVMSYLKPRRRPTKWTMGSVNSGRIDTGYLLDLTAVKRIWSICNFVKEHVTNITTSMSLSQ
jgi:hypothetical protein